MPSRPAPTLFTKLAYGFGSVAYGVKDNGFGFLLLIYYNQVLGVPERQVGLAIMLALVVDALSDPLVGYVSDHLHSRWGRRHPFMYAAAIPVAISYYLLWRPPAGLSAEQLFVYLVVAAIVVRTLITFYEIPSSSLVAELTEDYDGRTTLLGFRYFFGWWGGLTLAVLAYAVFLQPDAAHPVGVLNPAGYHVYGLVAAVSMAVAILVSALGTHPYIPHLRRPPAVRPTGLAAIARDLRRTLSNRSFLAIFGMGLFAAMAGGLVAALNVYFNTFFWELSSSQISILVMGNFFSAAVALPIAPRLSARYGKHAAAMWTAVAAGLIGGAPMVLRLLDLFPANHSPALMPVLFACNTVVVTLIILTSVLVSAMVADVVEDSEITTGQRSEGTFFAANSFVQKTVSGIGIFGSTMLLAAVGFPTGAQPGDVPPEVVRNLALLYVPALLLLYAAAVGCLSRYRISRASHLANLEALARRSGT